METTPAIYYFDIDGLFFLFNEKLQEHIKMHAFCNILYMLHGICLIVIPSKFVLVGKC